MSNSCHITGTFLHSTTGHIDEDIMTTQKMPESSEYAFDPQRQLRCCHFLLKENLRKKIERDRDWYVYGKPKVSTFHTYSHTTHIK